MSDVIEEWRSGDVTASLAAVAALLRTLPIEGFREAVLDELSRTAAEHSNGAPEFASATHRRARRQALLVAAGHAVEFVAAVEDAMRHNRACARALDLEASMVEEQRSQTAPARSNVLRLPSARHPAYAGLLRVQDEELPHDPA